MNRHALHYKAFLILLVFVTVAFAAVLMPFYSAVFWGAVFALLFTPLYRRLLNGLHGRRNLAAVLTLLICVTLVILPVTLIGSTLVRDGMDIYQRIQSGEFDVGAYLQRIIDVLPRFVVDVLERAGLSNFAEIQQTLKAGAAEGSQLIATRALNLGQNTFYFLINLAIMLYLLFFLLRDGSKLSARIRQALPLSPKHKQRLLSKFTTVIRATVKGNIAVAATQGALGGLVFAFLGIQGALLWGTVMAFLSLLPAIGAGLVWLPVAIWFLLNGAIAKGVGLIAFGVLVIGLVDNILRPILVGKDTQIPDYVILISTIGGMALFGLNGFVIGPVIAALFISAWDIFSEPGGGHAEAAAASDEPPLPPS